MQRHSSPLKYRIVPHPPLVVYRRNIPDSEAVTKYVNCVLNILNFDTIYRYADALMRQRQSKRPGRSRLRRARSRLETMAIARLLILWLEAAEEDICVLPPPGELGPS